MIKYIEFDSIDEYGSHIIPAFPTSGLIKTASGLYSPTIMQFLSSMKKDPKLYYVVVNALGSYEGWGPNRNGDAFPEDGLTHVSLRTDMGTLNDYGYKTFEYYAKLYKHHVNKDPHKSFGDVVFSSWNPIIKRVELVVGIYRDRGASIIEAIENGNSVAVSMGCKVKYDRCSICQNKAKSRSEYCIHLQNYLRQIVSREMADRWSRELGITILPGSAVMMFNDHPKFFDISEVYIGAERTAFVLGKAAHIGHVTPSIDIADAYGVTDNDIDKLSMIGKKSEIDKKIGGPDSLQDFDGQVVAVSNKMKDKIDVTNLRVMADEPEINTSVLNSMAQAAPLSRILSTMLGMGIQPKPREFQRIVLVSMGSSDIADALDKNNEIFDYTDEVKPIDLPIGSNGFDDCISRMLVGYVRDRSAYPEFLEPRFREVMDKSASYAGDLPTNYWHQNAQGSGPLITQSKISPLALTLGGVAALYMGLKLRAAGYSTKVLADTFASKPWLQALIGGSILARLMSKTRDLPSDDFLYTPASAYANVLQDTGLTGQMQKTGSLPNALGLGLLTSAVVLPGSYIMNAYNQKSLYQTGRPLFPGAGTEPRVAAALGGLAVTGGVLGYDKAKVLVRDAIKKGLLKIK